MRVLNDYGCDTCDYKEELFLDNDVITTPCPSCGGVAKKIRSVPNFMLPGNDPQGFPTAADKWVKKREEKMAEERKFNP